LLLPFTETNYIYFYTGDYTSNAQAITVLLNLSNYQECWPAGCCLVANERLAHIVASSVSRDIRLLGPLDI